MSSEARVKANRHNAQESTGPRTAEGKAAAAQNAVKHGLAGQCDVIRGEDQKEFDQYREEMFWELNPVGVMQSRLTERIVSLAWRLRRAERLQNEPFDALLTKETSRPVAWMPPSLRGKEQDADDSVGRTVVRDFANSRVLDRLLMYERRQCKTKPTGSVGCCRGGGGVAGPAASRVSSYHRPAVLSTNWPGPRLEPSAFIAFWAAGRTWEIRPRPLRPARAPETTNAVLTYRHNTRLDKDL